MLCALDTLQTILNTIQQAAYPHHSRVHPLRHFHFPSTRCFVKREDELGFGISGSKIRKYRTLIPWLVQKGVQEVVLIGSASSNHILGLSQLLIENAIVPTLFLRGDPSYSLKGNCLLSNLCVPSSSIHWITKSAWHSVESLAYAYAAKHLHSTFVLAEGGSIAPSLPGALTLALDILENEKELSTSFDHIFIEAGTGFMASALILGFSFLKMPSTIHVVLLADDKQAFQNCLANCHSSFQHLMQTSIPFAHNFILHEPTATGNFGKTHPFIFQFIRQIAQEEGFLTDPVYTAKLFFEGKHILSKGETPGNVLFLHSGGALSLTGFLDQLL